VDADDAEISEIVEVREVASRAVGRGSRSAKRPGRPAGRPAAAALDGSEVRDQLVRDVGPSRAPRLAERLAEASRAFSRERYDDARRMLRPLAQQAPTATAVRELNGLTLYRLGKWRDAIKELEQFRLLSGSTEQHPVLADCYRALGRYTEVTDLWRELREASPSAPLVAEGRIVMAGSLADQDRLSEAIRVMEQGVKFPRRPQVHHLRMWYALADLYERAGDIVRSRQLFERIVAADTDFADAAARLRALR
jgi:tetratricopeptide (TPR) repeat protein